MTPGSPSAARARPWRPTPTRSARRCGRSRSRRCATGLVEQVSFTVDGRLVELAPVTGAAAPVVTGEEVRDLGALVARMVLDAVGVSIALDGETLRLRF